MKKFLLLLLTLIALIPIYIIGNSLLHHHTVTLSEQKSIASCVNNYYKDLQNNNFGSSLSLVYNEDKDMNNYINNQSTILALKEIFQNVYTKFQINTACNYEDVFYNTDEKAYYAHVLLNLGYKNTSGGKVNEVLFLKKYNGKWKIVKIQSPDRYVIYRSYHYNIDTTPWFLIPTN